MTKLETIKFFSVLGLVLCTQGSLGSTADEYKTDFEFFDTCESASSAAKKINSAFGFEMNLINCSDQRYAEANHLVDQVFSSYKIEFPDIQTFPRPHIVIYERQDPDAAVMYNPESQKIPWLITMTSALMNPPMTDEGRMGILAHEFAHVVLKHTLPKNAGKSIKFYFSDQDHEPLGFLAKENVDAKSLGSKWIVAAEIAGATHLLEQRGIPYGSYGNTILPQIFSEQVVQDLKSSAAQSCSKASDMWSQLINILSVSKSYYDWMIHPSPAQKNQIADLSLSFKDELAQCPLPQRKFSELLQAPSIQGALMTTSIWYGDSIAKLVTAELKKISTKLESSTNYAFAILAVTTKFHDELRKIETHPQFTKVRYFNSEDQADDTAIRVLKHTGAPYAVKSWMLDSLKSMSALPGITEDYFAKCSETLSSGKIPEYGSLIDMHHSACFRAYHNIKYVEWLESKDM